MKIGIDLDEVVVETMKEVLAFYNSKYGKNLKLSEAKSYHFWEFGMGRNKEEAVGIVLDFFSTPLVRNIHLMEGAREGIGYIKRNHEGFFVTSRAEEMEKETRRYLKEKFGEHFPVYFSMDFHGGHGRKSKSEIGRELGLDIIIDDSWDFAHKCASAGMKAFLFDRPWNQGQLNGNPTRVMNWKDIIKKLEETDGKL